MKIKLEPVLALLLPVLLLGVIAAIQAFLDGEALRGVISAALTAIVAALTVLVRGMVTPVEKPRTKQGAVLVPKGDTV